jgi:hypothetical protein
MRGWRAPSACRHATGSTAPTQANHEEDAMKAMTKLLVVLVSLCTAALATAAPEACKKKSDCVPLAGTVSSGVAGVAGAAVIIYQADGNSPRVLATATSDAAGQFSVALPADGKDGIRYALARKDETIELAAVIGMATPPAITINEMTTVAAAYAMAQFFRNGNIVGKSLPLQVAAGMAENLVSVQTGTPSLVIQASPNADETNTFRSLGTLANILAGCVQPPGAGCAPLFALTAPAKGPKPTTTLEAVRNIARNPMTNVGPLFALGDVARAYEPYLEARHAPDSPIAELQLDGFTLAVKVNATGRVETNGDEECPFGGPGNLAFDRNGYAWITNNVIQGTRDSAHCFVVLKPNGQPADGTGDVPDSPIVGGGIVGQGFGIGIDPSGDVWAGNFGWGADIPIGSVSQFAPDGTPVSPDAGYTDGFVGGMPGLDQVQGTTSDQKGNIWMASYENDSVHIFPKGDPDAGFPPYADHLNERPFHIVIDDDGDGWVTYTKSSTLSKFALSKTGLARQFTVRVGTNANPKGMALDSRGNAWVTAGALDLIYAFDKKGKTIGAFGGGGILGPWGVGVDSDDNVWVANFGPDEQIPTKYRVSRLCGASVNNCPSGARLGDPISPPTGYTLPSGGDEVRLRNGDPLYAPLVLRSYKPLMRATAAHIDMAGNVWITNNWKPSGVNDVATNPGGDGMVIFVGLAAPVKPAVTAQPKAP